MNYIEFRRHLGKAGMTINDFAAYLGVRPASVSNHSKLGAVPRSYALLAVLLGDVADRGIPVREVLSRYGLYPVVSDADKIRQLDMFRAGREAQGNTDKYVDKERAMKSDSKVPCDGASGD